MCAPPVPEDLGATLPLAVVQRDGGTRLNIVMDSHNVTVYVCCLLYTSPSPRD